MACRTYQGLCHLLNLWVGLGTNYRACRQAICTATVLNSPSHDTGWGGEQSPLSPADTQVVGNLMLKSFVPHCKFSLLPGGGFPGKLRRPLGSADPAVGEIRPRLPSAHLGGIADR